MEHARDVGLFSNFWKENGRKPHKSIVFFYIFFISFFVLVSRMQEI